jgi:excisionase family DNA binding protein
MAPHLSPMTDLTPVETACSEPRVADPLPLASPYLTCPEAAAYLRSTVATIYDRVKRGRLHPVPGSRKLLFTLAELDRFLRTRSGRRGGKR